jgi:hypothetical protein
MKQILLSLIVIIGLSQAFFGQNLFSNDFRLVQKCTPNATQKFAVLELVKNGNVEIKTCPGKLVTLNGTPIGSSSTTPFSLNGLTSFTQSFGTAAADMAGFTSSANTHTLNLPIASVSGTARANYLPSFNGQNSLSKSDIFSTNKEFTAFKSENFQFLIKPEDNLFRLGSSTANQFIEQKLDVTKISNDSVKLGTGGGKVEVGDFNNTVRQTLFTVDDSIGKISAYTGAGGITLNSSGGEIAIGDVAAIGNETWIRIDDNSSVVNVQASNGLHVDSLLFGGQIKSPQYNISSTSLCKGNSDLTNGIITIASDCAEPSSLIFVQATKSSIGNIRVSSRNHHAFTVSSGNTADNTSFYWFIVNQL